MITYQQEQLREMCSKVNLLEYAQNVMEFKRSGHGTYVAHCPKHVDKTASLTIFEDQNRYYCFSCHRKGNILNFMKDYEGMSFNEAVERLAKMTGTEIKDLKQSDALGVFKRVARYENKKADPVKHEVLPSDYMDRFSIISGEPHEWIEEGIDPAVMERYGIRIDTKSNRIVYPVYDNDGNLIGVKGRTRFENYKLLGIPKYMNYTKIGTTDFFQGIQQASPHIFKRKEVIVVEGLKSVMKLAGWGYENAIAAETSRMNDSQINLLIKMGVKDVVIAFDKDVSYQSVIGLTAKLRKFANVYAVIDKEDLLQEKESPCDEGREVWERLYSARIRL